MDTSQMLTSCFYLKEVELDSLPEAIHKHALAGYLEDLMVTNVQSVYDKENQRRLYTILYSSVSSFKENKLVRM